MSWQHIIANRRLGVHDTGQVYRKLHVVSAQPLLRSLHLGTEALHREPEFGRVVRDSEMHDFVRDEIAKHDTWCEDETPIERQIPTRGAVAPLRSLIHHVNATRLLPYARRQRWEAFGNSRTRLSSQPILQSAGRRRSRLQSAPYDDLPIAPPDEVAARLSVGDLQAYRGRRT